MKVKRTVTTPVAPCYDPERDGVTFSVLTQFKACRELCRLSLNGWTAIQPSLPLIFGGVIHEVFHRVYADPQVKKLKRPPSTDRIHGYLTDITKEWRKENPKCLSIAIQHLEHTETMAAAILPIYFKHWHEDFTQIRWMEKGLEHEFKIPISGHVGRTPWKTFLRGKMDGVFFKEVSDRPWLFETKTKGRIEEGALIDIMPFELQVNTYLIALYKMTGKIPAGVKYNILRRPQLRQKQQESLVQFGERIVADIHDRPDFYFIRMDMTVDMRDLDRAEQELMDLIGDFIMWWKGQSGHYKNSDHCENKYGTCHMLPICSRRDTAGFYQRDRVFVELEGV
jgi:hypothetical protein